jgi:hypothetical protein
MTGTVRCLQLSEKNGSTTIQDAAGARETFTLYFLPGTPGGTPPTITAFTRILHSMWVSLLREAHANNLTVDVIAVDGSAVTQVRLGVP